MYFGNHDFYYITLVEALLYGTSEALYLLSSSSSSKNRAYLYLKIVLSTGKSS
jgi:hypothetical protein